MGRWYGNEWLAKKPMPKWMQELINEERAAGIKFLPNRFMPKSRLEYLWDIFERDGVYISKSGLGAAHLLRMCEERGVLYSLTKKRAFDYVYWEVKQEK